MELAFFHIFIKIHLQWKKSTCGKYISLKNIDMKKCKRIHFPPKKAEKSHPSEEKQTNEEKENCNKSSLPLRE